MAKVSVDSKAFESALAIKLEEAKVIARHKIDNLAEFIEDRARGYAPTDSGALEATIRIDPAVSTPTTYERKVGPNISYDRDVEFGTAPHIIRVKNASVLTNGIDFFGPVVHHPGTRAQPYMRPAVLDGILKWLADSR